MMIMKKLTFLLIVIILGLNGYAQNDPILLTIGDENITKSTFVNAFNKNNDINKATPKELNEYLELYINFRLKVKEGKFEKIDTSAAFQREFISYRNQSAQQYLIDREVTQQLMDEAIDRAKYMIRASHLLIECSATASPSDTLAAYKKIMQIRNEILDGLSFGDAAFRYSDDPSARDRYNKQTRKTTYGNKGDLGYFTVFNLIYPFETAAYNTPVGKISMPIRTNFGYHLVYVQDRQPAILKISAAQIFIADTMAKIGRMAPETKKIIAQVQEKYKAGMSIEELATQFSDDGATKGNGGRLEPFAPNKKAGNFVYASITTLQDQISEPVPSNLGWHIVSPLQITYVDTSTNNLSAIVKSRITRDARTHKSKESLVIKLQKEYNYNDAGKAKAFKFLEKNIPAGYFSNPDTTNLSTLPGIEKLKPICTFADQKIYATDFAKFIARFQGMELKDGMMNFFEERFGYFIQDKILLYENKRLEKKYPEFNDLVTEYYDGMILYEINSEKVWNKSIKDSVGLAAYYEQVKHKYPVDPANPLVLKPFSDVRALVVTEYQNELDRIWINELKTKYPVVINREVFATLNKK